MFTPASSSIRRNSARAPRAVISTPSMCRASVSTPGSRTTAARPPRAPLPRSRSPGRRRSAIVAGELSVRVRQVQPVARPPDGAVGADRADELGRAEAAFRNEERPDAGRVLRHRGVGVMHVEVRPEEGERGCRGPPDVEHGRGRTSARVLAGCVLSGLRTEPRVRRTSGCRRSPGRERRGARRRSREPRP